MTFEELENLYDRLEAAKLKADRAEKEGSASVRRTMLLWDLVREIQDEIDEWGCD